MKTLKHSVIVLTALFALISCGGGTSKQPANAEGFGAIEKEIKSKFGDNAYFTDLNVLYIEGIGNSISLTVTEAPESLKMGQWDLSQNTWTQRSDITLEIPEGSQAKDFMFQLDDTFSLAQLGGLVEQAKQKLKDEKDLKNPVLSMASIVFPDNGDVSKAFYSINLKPESGGTTFSFYYKLNGELEKMDY
jgi:hypothetical protein